MNCTNCNTPLAPNARFCPNCGATVAQIQAAQPSPLQQPMQPGEAATIRPTRQQAAQWPPAQPQQGAPGQVILSPSRQAQPSPIPAPVYQPANAPGAQQAKPKRRRRRVLLPSLITFLVILAILAGGWFLGIRPYLDSLSQSKLNTVMTQAVNNIPSAIIAVAAESAATHKAVPVPENALNNLLVVESSPSDIVQNTHITITTQNFRFDFQVYGFSCSVTGVPQASNGKLTVTNVTLSGIVGLILTPDELTTIINNHLADAVTRLQHPVSAVQLKEHELDLTFGTGSNSGNPPISPTSIPTSIPTNIPTGIPSVVP